MKILIAATLTPFIYGGADYHISGLSNALMHAGHQVEIMRMPFRFEPPEDVRTTMSYAEKIDMNRPNGIEIDRVISLQFPIYGLQHTNHCVWLMHQHRAVYELYDLMPPSNELMRLRNDVIEFDNKVLCTAKNLYANSRRVAERLEKFNNLKAIPLYHPPAHVAHFYKAEPQPYIFIPSRFETLKRQALMVEAAQYIKSPLKLIFAGDGGQYGNIVQKIEKLGVQDKVRMLGRISEAEKFSFYANSLAICFIPFDEDYGYITLEAMLSSKPVLTCTDSGGPLEFVEHLRNGWIETPEPKAIAERLDWIYNHQREAKEFGLESNKKYSEMQISWSNVVENLLKV